MTGGAYLSSFYISWQSLTFNAILDGTGLVYSSVYDMRLMLRCERVPS